MKSIANAETTPVASPKDVLEEILRAGAQKMLIAALEAEVEEYITRHASAVDAAREALLAVDPRSRRSSAASRRAGG